jgi:hypothetical protein
MLSDIKCFDKASKCATYLGLVSVNYLDYILINHASVPDRTAYILC